MQLVLRQSAGLVLMGIVIGTALSAAAHRLVTTQLFGVSGSDPSVVALTAITVALVALTASAVPTIRASRIDPLEALRGE
jgi:ABC-type antimicrobial peptide transport system permease subunit